MSYLEYLRPLKEMMQPLPEPMVLLGDWNATPEMVAALTQQELFDLLLFVFGSSGAVDPRTTGGKASAQSALVSPRPSRATRVPLADQFSTRSLDRFEAPRATSCCCGGQKAAGPHLTTRPLGP